MAKYQKANEAKERILAAVEVKVVEGRYTKNSQAFWEGLIKAILSELDDIIYEDENGKVKINWLKAILSIGRIVGSILALREAAKR